MWSTVTWRCGNTGPAGSPLKRPLVYLVDTTWLVDSWAQKAMCSVQELTNYHSTILENSGPYMVIDTDLCTARMCSRFRVSSPVRTSHTAITHTIMYMYVYVFICMYMYVYVCICMYTLYVCSIVQFYVPCAIQIDVRFHGSNTWITWMIAVCNVWMGELQHWNHCMRCSPLSVNLGRMK